MNDPSTATSESSLSPPPGRTPSEMFPVLDSAQQARVLAHGQRRTAEQVPPPCDIAAFDDIAGGILFQRQLKLFGRLPFKTEILTKMIYFKPSISTAS